GLGGRVGGCGGGAVRRHGIRHHWLGASRRPAAGENTQNPQGGPAMGEGASSVEYVEPPGELEREIEHLRDDMTAVVREIDRRREEVLDWRLQLKRHQRQITTVAVGIVLLFAAVRGLNAWRDRRRIAALSNAERLRQLLARIVAGEDGAWNE